MLDCKDGCRQSASPSFIQPQRPCCILFRGENPPGRRAHASAGEKCEVRLELEGLEGHGDRASGAGLRHGLG